MQPALWFVLLIGSSSEGTLAPPPRLAGPPVAIVKFEPCKTLNRIALRQITEGKHNPVGRTPHAVESLADGLAFVRSISDSSVPAATEANGWYIYATVVTPDEQGNPSSFITGYAIKKGSRDVISWSVW